MSNFLLKQVDFTKYNEFIDSETIMSRFSSSKIGQLQALAFLRGYDSPVLNSYSEFGSSSEFFRLLLKETSLLSENDAWKGTDKVSERIRRDICLQMHSLVENSKKQNIKDDEHEHIKKLQEAFLLIQNKAQDNVAHIQEPYERAIQFSKELSNIFLK